MKALVAGGAGYIGNMAAEIRCPGQRADSPQFSVIVTCAKYTFII